jgi:cyclopropane-fatty-acyl-phospholipid synthase
MSSKTISASVLQFQAPPRLGVLDRLARRVVARRLAALRGGQITLEDSAGATRLGEPAELHAAIRINEPRFFRDAVAGGTLSVAESYLRGDWDCDDLTGLFRIFIRNGDAADRLDGGLGHLARQAHRLFHWWRGNSRSGSRRNIAAHYDLGNDFFRLWLDDSMAYSSGIFPVPTATLREASVEKFDRVCRKLDLRPDDHVLEIGAGWGGWALHAAQNYRCRVTTTTISQAQFEDARERVVQARLTDRISLLLRDYRDLTGQFDKLVSIEMVEAVGHQYLDAYFRKCGELLRPEGSLVLQAIVMPERRYPQYLRSVDFIQRYVFPGGCLPSLSAMLESVGRTTDLRFVHAEDFAPHYGETLRRWRRAFHERLDDVRRLGYPDEFIRLWTYYLCYCEAVFEERHVGVLQIQFDKPQCRRDPIRLSERAAASYARSQTPRFLAATSDEPYLCGQGVHS